MQEQHTLMVRFSFLRPAARFLLPLLAATTLTTWTVQAQTQQTTTGAPPQLSAAEMAQMRQDVQAAAAWPLPADFIPRMTGTLQALKAAGLQPPPPGNHLSLGATIDRVSSVRGIDTVLKAHGFTPRSFVMGLTCFGMTVALTSNPQAQTAAQVPKLNPANIALIQANPQGVQGLMQEMSASPQ